MNFLSINIKGVGLAIKEEWVRDIKIKEGISFLAIQETLASDLGVSEVSKLWDNPDFGMDFVGASGRSGGLLNIWDEKVFSVTGYVKDRNFLLSKGVIKGSGDIIFIVNVYATQGTSDKRALWERLLLPKDHNPGLWVFLGDFNAVRFSSERRNSMFDPISTRDLNTFIFEENLVEYAMKGGKFMFLVGNKLSKIDRMLVSSEFANRWPDACLRVLPKFLSDHQAYYVVYESG
ncbi:uncharacterized protein LOC143579301 [Bidens hawaiensis]|uniref:uncharacterized protein LOC143579301 n=1 Tax=Bidens hawaiensis TaxID=980011 RepID=UPI00404AB43F